MKQVQIIAFAYREINGLGNIKYWWDNWSKETVEKMNKDCYLNLSRRKFVPALRRKGLNADTVLFQQDGAVPCTAGYVIV